MGAIEEDSAGSGAGAVYVLGLTGSGWSEEQKLTASDAVVDDSFGKSLSVFGDVALFGAYSEDSAASNAGAVYVFGLTGSDWSEEQKLTASDAAASDLWYLSECIRRCGPNWCSCLRFCWLWYWCSVCVWFDWFWL